MLAIVQHDVHQTGAAVHANRSETAQPHEQRTVTVDDDHRARRVRGHPEPDRDGRAHRADEVEVRRTILNGVEFPAGEPGGRDDRRIGRCGREQLTEHRRPGGALCRMRRADHRRGRRRQGDLIERGRGHRVLLDHDCVGAPLGAHVPAGRLHDARHQRGIAGHQVPRDLQQVQQRGGHAPHQLVLRLVFAAGFTPPGDHQQGWDERRVQQGGERVDHVAQAGVLADRTAQPTAQPGASDDRGGLSLLSGGQVPYAGVADSLVDHRG